MKKWMMVLCCICAVAAVPAAQTAAPDKMDKMDKGKMDTAAKKGAITVTGCVAAGTEPDHYMLTNVMKTGETGGGQMVTYALMGGELKPHVGHKVEVTGTMEPAMAKGDMAKDTMAKDKGAMDKGAMDKGAMNKTMKDGDKAMMHDTLHVKSVKMLAATCS